MKECFDIEREEKMRKICDGGVYLNSHGDKITVLQTNWNPFRTGLYIWLCQINQLQS